MRVPFTVGALVIGSLLWDTAQERRRRWHDEWLDLEGRYLVRAPVRYGRRSAGHRADTHTMVLSNQIAGDPGRLGTAWVVPHRRPLRSAEELAEAVRAMGQAEGFADGFHDHWGWVAVATHPGRGLDAALRERWPRAAPPHPRADEVARWYAPPETPTVDAQGFLTVPWPAPADATSPPPEPDVLLATVTRPAMEGGRYASPAEIATRMHEAGYTEYFDRNRRHGITTFEDDEILAGLARLRSEESS